MWLRQTSHFYLWYNDKLFESLNVPILKQTVFIWYCSYFIVLTDVLSVILTFTTVRQVSKQCLKNSKMEMQTFKYVTHYWLRLKPQPSNVWSWLFNLFPEMPGRRQKLIKLKQNKWGLIILNQCSKKTSLRRRSLWLATV